VFVKDDSLDMGLFLIPGNQHNRFFIVIYRIIFAFGGIGLCGNIGKQFLNLCFDGIYIYVSHHNYTLQIGTIPLFIIIS